MNEVGRFVLRFTQPVIVVLFFSIYCRIALSIHPLKGERHSFWAVDVSGNWCVLFRFENGNAVDVDYDDYH
ncbi:MAG: type II toxin-antitoxin system RelE/ParE family toxin [Thermodesulfobacteriota bacterium]